MSLLDDLKNDVIGRIQNVDSVKDMLILYGKLRTPIDTNTIDPYFNWYRLKLPDELNPSDLQQGLYDVYFTSEYIRTAKETKYVRLLDNGEALVNEALFIEIPYTLAEPVQLP